MSQSRKSCQEQISIRVQTFFSSPRLVLDYEPIEDIETHSNTSMTTGSRLSKRATRHIADCPYGPYMSPAYIRLVRSSCESGTRSGYEVVCSTRDENADVEIGYGHCERNEICVTEPVSNGAQSVALCISNWDKIKVLAARKVTQFRRLIARTGQPTNVNNNFKIALTQQNNESAFFTAEQMSISPKDEDNNTISQFTSCQSCDSLDFPKWPTNLDHLEIDITMPHENDVANAEAFIWV